MFRITEDPLSGSPEQCLAKNYKNDSIVSVDMDKVGVMTAYSDQLCVCVVHCLSSYFYPIITKIYKCRHISVEVANKKFHKYSSSGNRADRQNGKHEQD